MKSRPLLLALVLASSCVSEESVKTRGASWGPKVTSAPMFDDQAELAAALAGAVEKLPAAVFKPCKGRVTDLEIVLDGDADEERRRRIAFYVERRLHAEGCLLRTDIREAMQSDAGPVLEDAIPSRVFVAVGGWGWSTHGEVLTHEERIDRFLIVHREAKLGLLRACAALDVTAMHAGFQQVATSTSCTDWRDFSNRTEHWTPVERVPDVAPAKDEP